MKRILIVYYSRTGFTRRIAKEIAGAFDCEIEEIREFGGRSGALGLLRSVFQAATNRTARLKPMMSDPASFDLVVIGSPVWVGHIAAPVRAYMNQHQAKIKAMAFVCTYRGAGWENALRDMRALAGRWPVATLALTNGEITEGAYKEKLQKYIHRLSDHIALRLKAVA
jgi:flavodoxin